MKITEHDIREICYRYRQILEKQHKLESKLNKLENLVHQVYVDYIVPKDVFELSRSFPNLFKLTTQITLCIGKDNEETITIYQKDPIISDYLKEFNILESKKIPEHLKSLLKEYVEDCIDVRNNIKIIITNIKKLCIKGSEVFIKYPELVEIYNSIKTERKTKLKEKIIEFEQKIRGM